METGHGIVNGHWEPSERHSRLLEVVRSALEKLTQKESSQKESPDTTRAYEHELHQHRQSAE
jgi:hypothetical protein